jgi:Tol biopolymer transport system component
METGKHRLATDCVAGTGHPSFSPDGKFIAIERVSAKDGRGEIHLVDVGANSSECLVQMRVMNHTHSGTHLHPVWSWDGKQILYASDASGRAQLCVINV